MESSGRHSFTESEASVLLDLLRGLASLLVIGTHWRNLFFVDYGMLPRPLRLPFFPMYALTTNGHRAVVLFFILSGYLIGGSIFRSLKRDSWKWAGYLTHRLVRLWVVLLPGLLLCALFDQIGMRLNQAPLLYAGLTGNHLMGAVAQASGWRVMLANALFLQDIWSPTFGSDTPLWSLSYEFWYYILFPLAWIAVSVRAPLWRRAVLLVLFVLCAWFVRGGILASFPLWLMGVLLCWARPAPNIRWLRWLAWTVLFTSLYGLPLTGRWGTDNVFGIITMVCIWVLLGARDLAPAKSLFTRTARNLSRFSFTLYVVHMPLLMLLASQTVHNSRWIPSVHTLLVAGAVGLFTISCAWGIAAITEFRTDRVRSWMERRIGLQRDAPSPHEQALAN